MSNPSDTARSETFVRTIESLLGSVATDGNDLEILRNGDEIFPSMLDAIATADRSIDLLTFIYWDGEIGTRMANTLAARAQHGVRVRVLLDAVGARLINRKAVEKMRDAGCDVRWFRPVKVGGIGQVNHRTHRKVLICDETVGFTGGVGIADEWLGDARNPDEWRDTHFKVRGPAVDGLRAAFIDNWAETDGDLFDLSIDTFAEQPTSGSSKVQVIKGAAETGWSDIATLYRALVQLATSEINITTAYFSPDTCLLGLLCDAAERGVTVRILMPGPHADKRFVQLSSESDFERLLTAGVEIRQFQPSMLHAKVCTVDGLVATVGSANINNRSNEFDEEVNLVVHDPDFVAALDEHFDADCARSEQIDLAVWKERGIGQRFLESAVSAVDRMI